MGGEREDSSGAYLHAVREASTIIYRIDPVGISYQSDEYDTEAARVVARSRSATSAAEVRDIVRAVFDEAFWPGACSAEKAMELAEALWPLVEQLHGKA